MPNKNRGPKDLKAGLKPLKKVEPDTKLPYYFDMMHDEKFGRAIIGKKLSQGDLLELAKAGFDTTPFR